MTIKFLKQKVGLKKNSGGSFEIWCLDHEWQIYQFYVLLISPKNIKLIKLPLMIYAPCLKTNTRFVRKSSLLLQKLYCHFDLKPKMKKFFYNLFFSKIVFLHYFRRPMCFWKKNADINSPGYYLSDDT